MKNQRNAFVFIIFMFYNLAFASTQCNVNGVWYPYDSEPCIEGTPPRTQTTTNHPQQNSKIQAKPNITLPNYEEAWKGLRPLALARCAKNYDSLFLQNVCLENEEKGYMALKSNYNMPSKEAIAAKTRCGKTHDSWFLRDVCMKNESDSYKKLYGR